MKAYRFILVIKHSHHVGKGRVEEKFAPHSLDFSHQLSCLFHWKRESHARDAI